MGRKKRSWTPNYFYHVVCRGNRRDDLFKDDGDFLTFLQILQQVANKTSSELVAYCLMNNHFHLQLWSKEQSISKVMSLVNKRYADYYNKKNRITGHVFEKRYFGKPITSKAGMLEVSRYIHLNPVEAKIVERPERYRWSSYRYYFRTFNTSLELIRFDLLLDYFAGSEMEKRKRYSKYVNERFEMTVESEVTGLWE